MGLRRRRKKLTSVITNVDKRLKAVEFRHVPTRIKAASITTEEIVDGTIPPEDPKDSGATGSTSSEAAPSEFATLVSAAYSSRLVTGSTDRVDIVTTQPHGFVVGDKVTIYGVNSSDVDLSGTYKVTEVPSTTEFRYVRGLTGTYSTVVNPVIKYAVTSKQATLTEAGLVLNIGSATSHGLKVGEAITISGVGEPFDGTFLISSIDATHIYYKFATALTASISVESATGYANATVHKYAIIGDTWIDTSVKPSVIKVWNGLTWVAPSELPEGIIVNDNMAPKPPTNLRAIMRGYYDADGAPKVQATLSWDAPTENADDTALTDLGGYKVYHKVLQQIEESTPAADGEEDTTTPATDGSIGGIISYFNESGGPVTVTLSTTAGTIFPTTFNIRNGAQYAQGSHAWTVSGLTNTTSTKVSWSTSPSIGSGDITGTINSTSVVKNNTPGDLNGDITITSRTQTSDTVVTPPEDPTPTEAAWESDADTLETSIIIRELPMDSDVSFMVQAYDSSKLNISTGGTNLTVSTGKPSQLLFPPSKPSLEARLGTLTVTWDGQDNTGNTTPPQLGYVDVHLGTTSGFTIGEDNYKGRIEPGVSGYVVIGDLAYGTTWYAKLAFVSKTGVATAASVASDPATVVALVNTDLIANTLTTWPFQGKVVDLNALADGSVDASKLLANAVTQNAIAANAIGANQIIAGSIGAGKIAANAITAGTIAANAISAGNIQANAIEADKIKAGSLDAFVITGAQIQTAKSLAEGGQNSRIVLTSSGLSSYDTSGAQTFNINSATGVVTIGTYDTRITAANTTATNANTAVAGKISAGGAASDVNTYTTTISGGKITTGSIYADQINAASIAAATVTATTVTSSVISGSKYLEFSDYNGVGGNIVRLGYGAGSYADNPGMAITTGGTYTGWVGAWGGGDLEIATEFYNCYLDFFRADNSIVMRGQTISIKADPINGSTGYMDFKSLRLTQVGAMTIQSDNASAFRVEGTGGTFHMSLNANVDGIAGNTRLFVDPKVTTRQAAAFLGTITHYGSTNVSSRRFKTDIRPYDVEGLKENLLDVVLVNYKYLNTDGILPETPSDQMGVIAEELVDLGLTDLVSYESDGTTPMGVDYTKFGLMLIPIVKDLKNQIDVLKNRLDLS